MTLRLGDIVRGANSAVDVKGLVVSEADGGEFYLKVLLKFPKDHWFHPGGTSYLHFNSDGLNKQNLFKIEHDYNVRNKHGGR